MTNIENIIIVRSKTRLEQLTERFNTVEQAKFYVTQQKKAFDFKQAGFSGDPSGTDYTLLYSPTNEFAFVKDAIFLNL